MNAYSIDLRIRCLALYDEGKIVQEVMSLLKISQPTVYRWLRQRKETGNVEPKTEWRNGHSHKITDLEEFCKFAQENVGLSAIELAKKWGNITPKTMRLWLKKAGFTRKKKVINTKNEMKKSVKHFWKN